MESESHSAKSTLNSSFAWLQRNEYCSYTDTIVWLFWLELLYHQDHFCCLRLQKENSLDLLDLLGSGMHPSNCLNIFESVSSYCTQICSTIELYPQRLEPLLTRSIPKLWGHQHVLQLQLRWWTCSCWWMWCCHICSIEQSYQHSCLKGGSLSENLSSYRAFW